MGLTSRPARRRRPGPERGPVAGLAARRIAAAVIHEVLTHRRPLDETLDTTGELATLEPRDAGFARAIATTTMRRLGMLRSAVTERLAKGLPERSGRLEAILITAAAQILVLDVPPHAAVDLAVRLVRGDRFGHGYAPLANAVLRRIAAEREAILAASDPLATETPAWLAERWRETYGEAMARAIAAAHREEPPLDLTAIGDPHHLAEAVGGRVLPTGTVRCLPDGSPVALPGFAEGRFFVQDAAAALPARLLGDVRGLAVLDMCAAPGGKTAQLAAAGARVTALDRSAARLGRLRENLARLHLDATVITADATAFEGGPYDAILLDAPCSATGTIRRHPDVAWLKSADDVMRLADLQRRLLERAIRLVKPGGRIVYATCSLEPEEGERQIEALLAAHPEIVPDPVTGAEVAGLAEAVTARGWLRTLPCHFPDPDPRLGGVDGFFAARLLRRT